MAVSTTRRRSVTSATAPAGRAKITPGNARATGRAATREGTWVSWAMTKPPMTPQIQTPTLETSAVANNQRKARTFSGLVGPGRGASEVAASAGPEASPARRPNCRALVSGAPDSASHRPLSAPRLPICPVQSGLLARSRGLLAPLVGAISRPQCQMGRDENRDSQNAVLAGRSFSSRRLTLRPAPDQSWRRSSKMAIAAAVATLRLPTRPS